MNRLFFGDNLGWLRDPKEFPDASVDLVYLDPPFNSNADYNVLFREASGEASQAQFHAFTDTWTWADAAESVNQSATIDTNSKRPSETEGALLFYKFGKFLAQLRHGEPKESLQREKAQTN